MAPHAHQREAAGQHRQQGPAPQAVTAGQGGSPALVSLQRELGVALDASQPLAARCSSLGKLHAVMASHQAHRPAVAVAMLPLFLPRWPQLVACLWDPSTPQLAAAAAPLLGIVGALVASSRAAAATADAARTPSAQAEVDSSSPASTATPAPAAATPREDTRTAVSNEPPPPPASLLFDWLVPLLTGAVPLPTGVPAPMQLQALLCKTLAYALQQLPSTTSTAGAAATTTLTGTDSTTTPPHAARAQQDQQGPRHVQAGPQAAGTAGQPGPAAAGAGKGSRLLLTVPVLPAAAEQLQQHAAIVMRAVQQLLEAVSTPLELLGPLLQLLLEVVRLAHTVITGAVLRDLLDLLLGWSLEPGLQAKDRQLINRVLVALRPSWLSEPQLAADVGGKLLVDLRHLLPPATAPPNKASAAASESAAVPQDPPEAEPPAGGGGAAAAAAADEEDPLVAAAAPGQQGDQAPPQQQNREQLHKLLVLLSCLVAILKATCDTPSARDLVSGALELIEAAHSRVSAHAAAAATGDGWPDSSWSAAATSLAGSMLALWEVVVLGHGGKLPAATADGATGVREGRSADDRSGGQPGDASQQVQDPAAEAARSPTDTQQPAFPTAGAAGGMAAVSRRTWVLVLTTLQLPLLPAEDAVGLLGSISRALTSASAVADSSSGSSPAGGAAVAVQAVLAQDGAAFPAQLAVDLWAATADFRSSPDADVQAATAAAYTAALVSAELLQRPGSCGDIECAPQQPCTNTNSSSGSIEACSALIRVALAELASLCQQLSQAAASSDDDVLSRQQQLSTLLFDLVLLESWLSCAGQAHAGEAPESGAAAATAAVGSDAAAAAGHVAEVLRAGLQQLLQQPPPDSTTTRLSGSVVDACVLDQMLAVCAAVLAAVHTPSSMRCSAALPQAVLTCLDLLLTATGVGAAQQVAAVQLLPQLLVQQPTTTANSTQQGSCAVQQQAVSVMYAAAASASPDVRVAAVEAAGAGAHSALNHIQQAGATSASAFSTFVSLMQLLASRCDDVDTTVAAAAQASAAQLTLPLYLLSIYSGGSNLTGSPGDAGSTHGTDTARLAAAAGLGVQWQQVAALQPQQRAFKAAQLAQLFDVLYHASPAMLQRHSQRATQQQQQQPQSKHAAQAATLYRLAQALPQLPAVAASGSSGSSSTTAGTRLCFEDLSSAAVTGWLLTQEASRQFVGARMRTHLGNPTQSFAALERVVQVFLQQLQGDGTPQAQARAWQRQVLQLMQAAVPQPQPQLQQPGPAQQAEPQQLLQAPGAAAPGATAAAAAAAHRRAIQPQQAAKAAAAVEGGAAAAEEVRLESEAAASSLLDFMYALEVNVQSATEGSMMRPAVSKSVMAFFAGNKKVCEDWFSRTRESLLWLSAAAGAQQHVMFHGMARLQELHAQLKTVTAHSQSKQQQLQQERERQKDQQQEGSSGAAAAAAAAAAAVSGLGGAVQQQQQQQQQQESGGRDRRQQQQQGHKAQPSSHEQQRKVRGRPAAAAAAAGAAGSEGPQQQASAAAGEVGCPAALSISEQLRLLQQQYTAGLLHLAAPVLSTLVLLCDACVAAQEPQVVLGLQQWVHKGFRPVWEALSQLYALDLLTPDAAEDAGGDYEDLDSFLQGSSSSAGVPGAGGGSSRAGGRERAADSQQQQQLVSPSMLLLSWLTAAAAHAAGRYEDALQLYSSCLKFEPASTPLGAATRPWIQEQMAACYAALADWQGLAELSTAQHQQGLQEAAPWMQHWQYAGAAGVKHLEQWSLLLGSAQEQQHGMGLHTIEQHLSGQGRGSRGGRGRASHYSDRGPSQHSSTGGGLHQLAGLDLQHSCFAGTSPALLAVLHATAALQMCADASAVSSSIEVGQPPASSLRGRGGRQQGRGRGRHSTGPPSDEQPSGAPDVDEEQQVLDEQQQVLAQALAELQQQSQALQRNPFVLCPAVNSGLSTSSIVRASGGLQQLSLMQLLQGQLAQLYSVIGGLDSAVQPSDQLAQLLSCLPPTDAHGSGSSAAAGLTSGGQHSWSAGLTQDGRLPDSLLGDVGAASALLQCVPSATAGQARPLLLRQALLACHSHGCSGFLQRLLQAATADSAGASQQEAQWLQLLSSKLQLQAAAAGGALAAAPAVEAHWLVLQTTLEQLQAFSSSSGGSASSLLLDSPDASSLAAAYLSLASILQHAPDEASWRELCAAYVPVQWVDWGKVHAGAVKLMQEVPCCSSAPAAVARLSAVQAQPQQVAELACCAAAVALLPAHPAPWRAYGDLLFQLAAAQSAPPAPDAAPLPPPLPQQQQAVATVFGAAAEAYCQHLAASANTGALTSPQQGLGVLIKLLQIILQQGEQPHRQLAAALAACPAAVWQALTNQLLAQLQQHSSTAVRGLIQQLLQGLAVVVPCAVLYPLVVEVRAAQEAGHEVPAEAAAVVAQLQRVQPRMMSDTIAMAEALEGLTVTRWEAWAGLLMELSLETNRKLLSLRADVSRQDQQHLPAEKRAAVFLNRYMTVMTPVINSLQQHIAATTASEPASPDDASFRQEIIPQLSELLQSLRQPPQELLKLATKGELSEDSEDSEDASDNPAAAPASKQPGGKRVTTAAVGQAKQPVDGGWPLLRQLRQQLQQHLRRRQHLQLASVAPQLSKLRNTAIPLPADDTTANMLPALPLKAALDRYAASEPADGGTTDIAGASVLLAATGAHAAAAEEGRTADPGSSGGGGSSSWLCIAAFDKQVAVLPTKTRPKRLLMLASDGSVHAFLLKGRDDLRVDERLMQFMQASNALLAGQEAATGAAAAAPASAGAAAVAAGHTPVSAAAAAVAGWSGGRRVPLRMRPYSITPFGRRAGLVQWVRHTTSLYGLFRNWQQCTAERYQAVAAAKRDAAAATAATAAAASAPVAGSGPGERQSEKQPPAAGSAAALKGAADGGSSSVPMPLIVAASRPPDAFYARLLPALQAAGLPVGSARSSWPASVLRSTFASLAREAPKALLARQLLSGAAEPGAWWSCQQAFSASAAAGSIVGWLLGLGDRHMDNLLLDRGSCELVHIDFSVCFDKGASLAVPEVVPFRLTQMMQVALGPGGLQGPFSAAAAAVLSTLRASADLLCGLLQLLLSDSSVDWSVDREAHAARKDQDTAVGLRLCASRLEELRHPLLANLAAALPTIGNGLAAVVSYGEAHVFMLQLQSTAAAAHARAAMASQAIQDAAADEVRALTSGSTAAKDVTSHTSDYRRLCGLAASCIQSAGSWLGRHVETLQALGAAGGSFSSSSSSGLRALDMQQVDWDAAAADRPLLLLAGNATAASLGAGGAHASCGLLVQALRSFLPPVGPDGGTSGAGAGELQALLPAELLQHCMQLDGQGVQLLVQQQELVSQGRHSLAAYAAVLELLLSGGNTYIKSSHHWAWSSAFTAAAAGPDMHNIATATAPQMPSRDQVATAWCCLAACWGTQQLLQQQLEAAISAAASEVPPGAASAQAQADQLLDALQQLSSRMSSSSAEADAAEVQFVASTALAEACRAALAAARAAAGRWGSSAIAAQPQPSDTVLKVSTAITPPELHLLQVQLSALQAGMAEFEHPGLAFVLDPSTSSLSDELPQAALSLEELLDAGQTEAAAAMLAAQQHQQAGRPWQQQLEAVAGQVRLLPQLLQAMQFEALGPIAVWHASAEAAHPADSSPDAPAGTPRAAGQQQHELVLLPAGAMSQQQLWHAAAAHVHQHWQQLQQLLGQAIELEGHMHALAAVAAASGAAAIWPEDGDLMSRAISLQQVLLPQGFDILTADECLASAQLLQAQWTDLEQRLRLALSETLCPMLGLQGVQDAAAGVHVLRQLVVAATAGMGGEYVVHAKGVLEILAADAAAAGGAAADSSSVWGVPGMGDAWRGLVVLLLQYSCLQQLLLRPQQVQADGADPVAAAALAGGPEEGLDVLRSSKALPLEMEEQRPWLVVVQVLHELLCCATGSQTAAAAVKQPVYLQQVLQGILLPPVLQHLLPAVDQTLASFQQHLQALASEAESVLTRHQLSSSDRPPAAAVPPVSLPESAQPAAQAGEADQEGVEDLVPFDAFDDSLPGADMLLEELGSGGSDSETGQQHSSTQGAAAAGLPDLVPFDAFDEELAGAGMALEGGEDGLGEGEEDGAGGGFFGALEGDAADLLGGALEDEQPAAAVPSGLQGSSLEEDGGIPSGAGTAARGLGAAEAAAQAFAQQLVAVSQHAAAARLQQQELAGLQQAQEGCLWQQQTWLRHLAAFEWLWGDMLPQQDSACELMVAERRRMLHAAAASLGLQAQLAAGADAWPGEAYQLFCAQLLPQLPPQPARTTSSSGGDSPDQQQQERMPTSLELLQSWQVLCEHQAAVAEALQAWQAACAAAAGAVADELLLGGAAGGPALQVSDPSVCRKMLSGAVARASHWLTGAGSLCSSLCQQAEAALQLEYSRRGKLWAPGMPEGVDAFQGNSALLQQLSAAATGLHQAQAQVAAAEALLASSQAAALQAQVTVEEAAAEAAAAEQQLALKTPAALVRAQGMVPVLEPMVAAAESALSYVTDGLGTTLRALVTLVERNSTARDLAPVVKAVCLQHARCLRVLQRLHDIGAAAVAGLSGTVQTMQRWQQEQGLPPVQLEQQAGAQALLAQSSPARDAHLLQVLLANLHPALAGVREELGELGQAHVLFTHLTEQLDSLAGAAETVAEAITSEHAMQTPAAGQARFMPSAAAGGSAGSSSSSGTGSRKQRAEARQRAFAAAALGRCTARLTGKRSAAVASGGEAAPGPTTRIVADEVAALVGSATSVDKLSRMYEGWAAWL